MGYSFLYGVFFSIFALFYCCCCLSGMVGGGKNPGPNSRVPPVDRENKLFVGMLPHDADDATLTDLFSRFGDITEVRR